MASKRTPEGVMSFDGTGKGSSTKGKAHPADIAPGLEVTQKVGGKQPAPPSQSGKGSRIPGGVNKNSGSANLGTKQNTMQSAPLVVPMSGKRRQPAGVRQHDGTRAPKRVKK